MALPSVDIFVAAPTIGAALILGTAAALDFALGRIPNWLTLSGSIGGLGVHFLATGIPAGMGFSAVGWVSRVGLL